MDKIALVMHREAVSRILELNQQLIKVNALLVQAIKEKKSAEERQVLTDQMRSIRYEIQRLRQ